MSWFAGFHSIIIRREEKNIFRGTGDTFRIKPVIIHWKSGGTDAIMKKTSGQTIRSYPFLVNESGNRECKDMSNGKMDRELFSAARRRSILVVEDEEINRELLAFCLQDEYEILCAASGTEAREMITARGEALSLVLLDLNLPEGYGLDILRWMREEGRLQTLPVIVMTSDRDAEVESLTVGAIDFIPKPYPIPEVIRARIRRVIELTESRDLIRETELDPLTGLYTPVFFFRYAEQLDALTPGEMDALVLDVNHFRMVNERFGKAYADEVLRRLGQAVRAWTKQRGGIACRRGADIFMIYVPHGGDYASLPEEMTRAADGEHPDRIRLRLGVYAAVDKNLDPDLRFDHAKDAADAIRGSLADTVSLYDDALHEKQVFEERLLDEFHTAIEEKQFQVYFQPKFDIRPETPVICGAEALVRWKHPELGMISPGVFIPLFEGNGLVRELDNYVWRTAAEKLAAWKKAGGFTVPVSVNVSRIDMLDPDLADILRDLVEKNGLLYSDIHLEITESAYTEDGPRIIDVVNSLRGDGFIIEMDDFGSGYSSLNMITTLPIDVLKLDMVFIRTAFSGKGDTRMLKVIIDISDSLEVPMIAEGVETEDQVRALRELGCEIVQGYYFARPMPAEEFETFMQEHSPA